MCCRLYNGLLLTYVGSGVVLVNAGNKWWTHDKYLDRAGEDLDRGETKNEWLNWYDMEIIDENQST